MLELAVLDPGVGVGCGTVVPVQRTGSVLATVPVVALDHDILEVASGSAGFDGTGRSNTD